MYVKNGKNNPVRDNLEKSFLLVIFFVKNAIWANFEVPAASQMWAKMATWVWGTLGTSTPVRHLDALGAVRGAPDRIFSNFS